MKYLFKVIKAHILLIFIDTNKIHGGVASFIT